MFPKMQLAIPNLGQGLQKNQFLATFEVQQVAVSSMLPYIFDFHVFHFIVLGRPIADIVSRSENSVRGSYSSFGPPNNSLETSMEADYTPCCGPEFWGNVVMSFVLVVFAGITSGLCLGLLSHSKVDLEVLIKAGLPKDRKNAAKILPIIKNECFLLCTLLIAKSLATEALPIFLDRFIASWIAILVSVICVVIFVEVIPQAVCSRHGLSFGAKFTLFVRILFVILYPVSYPVSKVLDWFLGKNRSAILRRTELRTLVDLHGVKAGKGGDLTDDETTIVSGALGMMEKIAKDAMTPLYKAFSLDINSKLDMSTMQIIASKGHSRIPIYSDDPANIIGLILVKNLIFYHPEGETPLKKLTIRRILRVYDNCPLYDVLKLFQEGHGHMAVVVKSESNVKKSSANPDLQHISIYSDTQPIQTHADGTNDPLGESGVLNNCGIHHSEIQSHSMDNAVKQSQISRRLSRWEGDGNISHEELESLKSRFADEEVIGIITMEDVLEELLQEEIRDETDHHVEIHDKIRVNFLSRRSSSASLGRDYWRTPETSSTTSSCYHTPISDSPIPSFLPSPSIRRVLSSSPRKQILSTSSSARANSLLFHQFASFSARSQ